jgi:hypothetical protein
MIFVGRIVLMLLVISTALYAGETPPEWVARQFSDSKVLEKPGVYKLKEGVMLSIGVSKINATVRASRALHVAFDSAERDAKRRIARFLYPDVFSQRKSVAVDISRAQRIFERVNPDKTDSVIVAIVTKAKYVSITPLADVSVIIDAQNVIIDPVYLEYLRDPLLQMGGGRIFSHKNKWLALGVGIATLTGTDSLAERDALKRARLDAGKRLSETVFGSIFEINEDAGESQVERDGMVRLHEWSKTRTRENIEGELKQATEIGFWYTNDNHVAVVMAASSDPLHINITQGNEVDPEIPDFPDWNIDPEWEFVLLSYPRLLRGGAILYPSNGQLWCLGVGAAKLTGNKANDSINAPRAAEVDARRNIIRYLVGFSSKSQIEEIAEFETVFFENGQEYSSIVESLQRLTIEQASGFIRSLQKGGSWKSTDNKLLFQVHVTNIGLNYIE